MANATSIQVQVRIRRDTQHGELNDALYFAASEFFDESGKQKVTEKDIEELAAQRVANYERVIDEANQRVPDPEPTEEELFASLPDEYVSRLTSWAKQNGKGGV